MPLRGASPCRITPAGTVTEFPIPSAATDPHGMTPGPDGAIWFTETAAGNLAKVASYGTIS